MMRCPYCGGSVNNLPENSKLSFKRRAIYEFIRDAGPKGISNSELKKKFFPSREDGTIRSTIHYINKEIKPLWIEYRKSRVRILPIEDL